MPDPTSAKTRIAEIDQSLAIGEKSFRIGDRQREVELSQMREERADLQRYLRSLRGSNYRRVVFK